MTATQLVAAVCLVLVLFGPGLLVGAAGGLRGWLLAGAAPALTYGIVGIASRLVPGVLPRWSVWLLLGAAVVAAGIVFLVRLAAKRWLGRYQEPLEMPSRWDWRHHVGTAVGVALAVGIGLVVMSKASVGFTGVDQFWDGMAHSNAIRYIADSGQSAPSALRALNAPEQKDFFYPNGYHVVGATVVQLTGIPVNELINLYGGIGVGVFSLMLVALVRVANGRPALAVSTAVVAAGLSAFPFGLLFFGPLWPFGAGLVALPGYLALFVATFRSRRVELLALAALGAIGLAALHPSAALAAGIFCACFLVGRWIGQRKVPLADIRSLVVLAVLAGIYVLPQYLAATAAAGAVSVSWPLIGPPGLALGQLLFLNFVPPQPQWWLVALAVVGVIGLRRLVNLRWLMLAGLVFTFLYLLAASYKGSLVSLLTNPWWNDVWRFVAMVAIAQVVLIAHGLVVARDAVAGWIARRRPEAAGRPLLGEALLLVMGLLLAVVTKGLYFGSNTEIIRPAYADGPTLSDTERAAIANVKNIVPPGAKVMNDPIDGSPYMWALGGIRPVFGSPVYIDVEGATQGPDRIMLFKQFNQLDTNQKVRDIVRAQNIQYAWVGDGIIGSPDVHAPGMKNLDSVKSLQLVYQNPEVRLYKVNLDRLG